MSITYCECVFVALGIRKKKMRMGHAVICGLPFSTIFFFTLSHKLHDFMGEKNVTGHKMCVLI
jgi:hypothetical protein